MENIEVMFSSKSNDWSTPIDFFNELNDEFHFTLDPCADDNNHKVNKYYTIEDDGLLQDWEGEICFVNPPYSECDVWVRKCYEEAKKPNTTIVLLIPSRTDTKYFHKYIYPFWNGNIVNSDYQYAAGLIDGEGCVSIQEHSNTKKDGTVSTSYTYRISVKMTDVRAIKRLQKIFNKGNIYTEKRPESYKDCYKWEVNGIDAYDVSLKIYPFLTVKQEQVMYGLEYFNEKEQIDNNRKNIYYRKLKELKKIPDSKSGVNVEIRFVKGRLKFGESKNSAPFPSMVAIYRGPEE